MSLVDVIEFSVRASVIRETEGALRRAGEEGFELFVLWTGTRRGRVVDVSTAHVPDQQSFRGEEGLHVEVGADALHALNVWLYENGHTLAVQVHAHPGAAYHSETDNAYPIVTTLGGLSLVAPDFCRGGLSLDRVVGYRLTPKGWSRLSRSALTSLVQVVA